MATNDYTTHFQKLMAEKGFKGVKLSKFVFMWKDADGPRAPIYLADRVNDTFAMAIGTWDTDAHRDAAIGHFVATFEALPKDLRALLDKDDGKTALKDALKFLANAGDEKAAAILSSKWAPPVKSAKATAKPENTRIGNPKAKAEAKPEAKAKAEVHASDELKRRAHEIARDLKINLPAELVNG